MAKREMNIIITFKSTYKDVFPNVLILKVQPDEGVSFEFNIKRPGETSQIIKAEMDFCQSCVIEYKTNAPEAYERLINAVIMGDKSLFSTWEHIYLSWDYVNKLKEKYIKENIDIVFYKEGASEV